ncbi:hypothetical protein [Plantactinospora sp. CA-290183]|uniref:hypothetical protein n=1 Tax=Plantactinospora sp. CA-290183 TaxID=3240006 RepID=UPI003D9157DB
MTTATVRTVGSRPSTALRVAQAVTRIHLVLAVCLAGYLALWVTTLQSSEGQLTAVGVTRTEIKLMWFSLAGVVVLAVAGARLVAALPGAPPAWARRWAVGVHLLAVLNGIWQSTMVYQHVTLAIVLVPLLVTALLLVRVDRTARAARQ